MSRGKDKLRRFRENETFECLIQPEFDDIFNKSHPLKGHWREAFFKNNNPIILELGCGRGEYTVGLGEMYPDSNFIGIDIKGARMWRGAKTATENNMPNVGFLRTRIEFISSFFEESEIDEIWITFPDPQLKKNRVRKRLTAPLFLNRYSGFLKKSGVINLKTDSQHLHLYTSTLAQHNELEILCSSQDIYNSVDNRYPVELLSLKTTYESKFLSKGMPITFIKFSLGDKTVFESPFFEPDEHLGKE